MRRASVHSLGPGRPEDAAALARMQFAAWLETYPGAAPGIDERWVREQRGDLLTEDGAAGWRAFLDKASHRPHTAFCHTARAADGALTAVLCGLREDTAPDTATKAPATGTSSANVPTGRSSASVPTGTSSGSAPTGPPSGSVTLGPMYVLRRAQGLGIGSRLMAAFLAWAGDAPMRLWVTSTNEGAIRFYRRHGFAPTGEHQLWRGRLPNVRMVRSGTGEGSPPTV
ncbi:MULTISPECIES: GNAT family N-acetyltransferase [Streptomyces]|uniref:GNAT family N-acetyltransferase n=1 Tax=Streptomyces ramulosus TaxID=47762 RepID=A0ABW1FIE5_9ACTN